APLLAIFARPSAARRVAQTREQLLAALQPFAAAYVDEERRRAEDIDQASDDLSDQERLVRRVAHLRAIIARAEAEVSGAAFRAARAVQQPAADRLRAALALA